MSSSWLNSASFKETMEGMEGSWHFLTWITKLWLNLPALFQRVRMIISSIFLAFTIGLFNNNSVSKFHPQFTSRPPSQPVTRLTGWQGRPGQASSPLKQSENFSRKLCHGLELGYPEVWRPIGPSNKIGCWSGESGNMWNLGLGWYRAMSDASLNNVIFLLTFIMRRNQWSMIETQSFAVEYLAF